MSLTCPKPSSEGVEFLTDKGGKPIYINLFRWAEVRFNHGDERNWEVDSWLPFCMDALAQGIPVVGIDMSTGGDSTFKTAIKMQGDDEPTLRL